MSNWKERLETLLSHGTASYQENKRQMLRTAVLLVEATFDLSARLARLERAVFEDELPDECK